MKRILLTLSVFILIYSSVSAQFTRGSILLGGQLSFSGYTNNSPFGDQNTHSGNFTISPGKAITENTVVGFNLSYLPFTESNYYFGNNQGPVDYQDNGYGIGIYIRKYKGLGKDFYLFAEAGVQYNGSTESGKDTAGTKVISGSGNGGSIYLTPGMAYKISKKFFLEITIPNIFMASYSKRTTNAQGTNSENSQFTISTSLAANPLSSVGIGFRLNL